MQNSFYSQLLSKYYIVIYICTMAKVGSASFLYSLKKKFETHHFHSLDKMRSFLEMERRLNYERETSPLRYYVNGLVKLKKDLITFFFNVKKGQKKWIEIFEVIGIIALKRIFSKRKVILISSSRDPVARNISYYFWRFSRNFINEFGENTYIGNRKYIKSLSIEELIKIFFSQNNHLIPIKWFEDAFKIWDIDIKSKDSKSFDKEIGFKIYKKPNFILLFYRLEDLNSNINFILDYFKIDKFIKSNISSKMWYKDIYKKFLKEITFSEEYINKLYDSDYMRFFYTEEEINDFKKRWLKN